MKICSMMRDDTVVDTVDSDSGIETNVVQGVKVMVKVHDRLLYLIVVELIYFYMHIRNLTKKMLYHIFLDKIRHFWGKNRLGLSSIDPI